MTNKYIKVSDLEKEWIRGFSLDAYEHLRAKAIEMISVEDIKTLKDNLEITYQSNYVMVTYQYMQKQLTSLINPQPKKYGGLTVEQWEQLGELPYIKVYCEDNCTRFLHEVTDDKAIIKLLPDLPNMERVNINIPDGIKVETTDKNGEVFQEVSPIHIANSDSHYRILGVNDE